MPTGNSEDRVDDDVRGEVGDDSDDEDEDDEDNGDNDDNTFLTKSMYLSHLPCINMFGLPPSASCPVYRNVNDEESSFGIGLKGMYICFGSLESRSHNKILREEFTS